MESNLAINAARAWVKDHKALSAIIVVAAVLLGWFAIQAARSESDDLSEPLKKGAIAESVYGIGTVTATKSFQFKLGVTSTIRRVFVQEGDQVRRGQRLIDLDGVVFTAPFDGTITALPFKVGETVFPQAVTFSLVDLRDRYLVVSLEQQGALRVRRGQKAKLSFDSMRADAFDGTVEAVYSNENNFLVRIGIAGLPAQILPGMTADVAIGIVERRDVLLVPVASIESGKVYVKRGPLTTSIAVKIGIVDGAMAEIVDGKLKEGERILIRKKPAP